MSKLKIAPNYPSQSLIYLYNFDFTNIIKYLQAQTKFLALFIMRLSKKSIHFLQLTGFILMLVLMVVLNNRIEKTAPRVVNHNETISTLAINNAGIAPLLAQIPNTPEGALPIKLITNPNSPFLIFINNSFEFKNNYRYTHYRKQFLNFSMQLQTFFIIEFLVTARNKDIR